MSGPAVSIILITYNDAKRLMDAITSLREQTLRDIEIIIVDDASTDETAEIVAQVQRDDPRIVSHRLDVNSGGCSAPRNAGLALARGTWVMFCDSDDRFERHAAKNLLLAVEAADADLGCGVAERVLGKRRKRWREDAHEPGVLYDIEERPRLLYDTICVNKIYRRTWLDAAQIRFPEGVLYEDQVFTMECFLRAKRIAIIEQTVYFWRVEHLSDEPSITQQRHQERNVQSRVEVNRQIDTLLRDRPALRSEKDLKFLSHDLYLYLVSMLTLDDAAAQQIADPLVAYVQDMDLSRAADLRPALRIAAYHLLLGDLDGVRRAMRTIKWSSVLDVPVVREGERSFWGCEHLEHGPPVGGFDARWWLDITPLHPFAAPFAQRRYCHQVSEITTHAGTVTMTGHTVDAYRDFDDDIAASLVWQTASGVVLASEPVAWSVRGGTATWSWSGALPTLPRTQGLLCLHIASSSGSNTMPVRMHVVPKPFRSGDFGTVAWTGEAGLSRVGKAAALLVGRLLPRARTVVFGGEGPLELTSAAALAELIAARPTAVWVQFPSAPPAPTGLPTVQAGSFRHCLLLARRASVVTDGGPAPYARWVRGTRIAAVDLPQVHAPIVDRSPKRHQVLRAQAATWDALCAPASEAVQTWRTTMAWSGTQIPFHPVFEATRRMAPDRHLAVFACRGSVPAQWMDAAAALAGRMQLVFIRQDRQAVAVPAHLRTWVRDGRSTPLHVLLAGCQVFVTDGTPATWVAAALGVPVITWGFTVPIAPRARSADDLVQFVLQPTVDAHASAWAHRGIGDPVDDLTPILAQVMQ